MVKQTSESIESRLRSLPRAEPSPHLDERISQLAAQAQQQVLAADATPVLAEYPAESGPGFGWRSIISTALVAGLAGVFVGMSTVPAESDFVPIATPRTTDAVVISEVAQFEKLHGHSSHPKFSDCSKCHVFSTPEDQVVTDWDYHGSGTSCATCHKTEKPKTPAPVRS